MKLTTLFAALIALLAPAPAIANCRTYVSQVTQSSGRNYNPAEVTDRFVNLALSAPANLDARCALAQVVIASRSGTIQLRNGARALQAQFVPSSAAGFITPIAVNLSTRGELDLVRSGSLALPFLRIEPGQFAPPGDYTADLELRVGDGAPVLFSVVVRVEPAMRFVGGSGGTKTLSLGEVSEGAQGTDRFFYRTNSAMAVSIRSEHGGVLVHTLGKDFGAIPYAAYLSGQRLTLATPSVATLDLRNPLLQSEELRVVVEPRRNLYAGLYRDTLTLEFTPF